ncbi:laccase domain-containing protein [Treponema ruminis]|uniref:Purine nucleoside phosphorylase n=1 Tax=Treponema ruminis TaxID=744515 RepID=A0A7W8G9I4_9SPIR|nr:polyphenol oxidase family protein [Treponema ruminis]MBB5226348.1 hypothetical protein [Treponema ruminis]QSI02747.1 laccase domain-containing protein [Treponema ruminis]
MINTISIKKELESSNSQESKYFSFFFYYNGIPLESTEKESHALWGMTLLKAGSMRFRWNETNENRTESLKKIFPDKKITPLELIHSKTVFEAKDEGDTEKLQGDGIVTKNPLLIPTVTVADCLPIFLYDHEKKAIGAFHSGWKGTGIVGAGVEKMIELYGSKRENISAAIGPHIGDCCYFVDQERAEYFVKNFGKKCVTKAGDKFMLSLTEANLSVLKNAGIKEENIVVARDCTCCTKFENGENIFGSFRRQAAFLPPEVDADTRSRSMTVQAAFVTLN